jgi:hypothetical protein
MPDSEGSLMRLDSEQPCHCLKCLATLAAGDTINLLFDEEKQVKPWRP